MVLEGQDVTHRRPLPFPVGLTGVHTGAEPPGNVVARFFPERLLMILDLATQRPMEPLALRLLKAGKSRAVYDLIPPRDFVYKVSLEGGRGAEAEVARSLPQLAPETFSYPRVMLKLYWEREDTETTSSCARFCGRGKCSHFVTGGLARSRPQLFYMRPSWWPTLRGTGG